MSESDQLDVRDRIAELEDRVEALENRLEANQQAAVPGGIDRYDGYVLNKIEEHGREPSPRLVVRWYQEAGVRDKRKIKQRHKFLKTSGRVEQALQTGE